MSKPKQPAAASLLNTLLPNGWRVIELIERAENHTGGNCSLSYIVQKGDKKCFLKAIDLSHVGDVENLMDRLNLLTSAYVYERELLIHCKEKRLRKVVVAVDHGQLQVSGFDGISGIVYYLMFELADGDMRGQVCQDQRFDAIWSLSALHDVAIGLSQIHQQTIAHQDIKPSNILLFGHERRIADFGRASRKDHPAVHDDFHVAGDRTYAPPEQLYGYRHPEFSVRRFGCDLYMLGNMAAFMLTGINVTAEILSRLDVAHHPRAWTSSYNDVLPYVVTVYADVLSEVKRSIDPIAGAEIGKIIAELCNPDLARRGHPKNIGRPNQYSLERYISRLDFIHKQAKSRARIDRKSG